MSTKPVRFVLTALLFFVLVRAAAQETITLTAPETKPSNSAYSVERFDFDEITDVMLIQLRGQNGEAVTCIYNAASVPTGRTLWTGLNKANLSTAYAGNATTGSLKQRIFHRLVVMAEAPARCGKSLAGTMTGTVP